MSKTNLATAFVLVLALTGLGDGYSKLRASEPVVESGLGSYQSALDKIAAGIERIRTEYPQLAEFSSRDHCDRDRLVVTYGHKTHRAPRRGGWTSGVPNPDEDGIWFYIDFHDPASKAQIHTQPSVPRYRYDDKSVMFLILEGTKTKRASRAIQEILRDVGVTAVDAQ